MVDKAANDWTRQLDTRNQTALLMEHMGKVKVYAEFVANHVQTLEGLLNDEVMPMAVLTGKKYFFKILKFQKFIFSLLAHNNRC